MKILTIVIPIYNVEKYLEECLESVYNLNLNKEIILVNDESPDNCYKIIDKYKKLYSDETIVINQKNKGLSGARNSGLKIAKGKYIAFIDSDDFIDTQKYEEFFKKGKDENLDIIMGTYKKYKTDKELEICERDKKISSIQITTGKKFFEKSMELNSFREEVWDDIYNREFLIKNNLKFKEGLLHEDALFFIQALAKAERVKYIDIPFYIYRQREDSIMSTQNYKNQQHRIFIVNELIKLQNETKIKSLNKYSLNLLWNVFINQREVNLNLLNKLIFKEKYSLKSYLKILIMYTLSLKYKKIEIINI